METKSNIINRRTVEQLRRESGSKKVRLQPAVIGKGAEQKPLYFEDKDGNPTDVQKIAVINEAGQTLGWASKAICSDIKNKSFQKTRELVVLDTEVKNEDNTTKVFVTLSYAGENSRAFDLDSLYD